MRPHVSVRQFIPVALVFAVLIAAAVYVATAWPGDTAPPKAPDLTLSLPDDQFDRRFFPAAVAEIEQHAQKMREARERGDAMVKAGPLTPEQKAAYWAVVSEEMRWLDQETNAKIRLREMRVAKRLELTYGK